MTHFQGTPDILKELEATSSTLAQRTRRLNRRDNELTKFEATVIGTSKTDTGSSDSTCTGENLHKIVDISTHSLHRNADGGPMSKLQRTLYADHKCTECHDHSLTMNSQDWHPISHDATIQNHEFLARKERRDKMKASMRHGVIKRHGGRPTRVVDGVNHYHTSDESENEPFPCSIYLPSRCCRPSKSAVEVEDTVHVIFEDSAGNDFDEDEGEEGDDEAETEKEVSSVDSTDLDSSYKESSSPVKAWVRRSDEW